MSNQLFTGVVKDEPAEAYHARREYISSSPLPELGKSPLHFYDRWQNGMESTDPMERGNFIHKIALEQDISKYVARPLTEKGELVRSNSKEYSAFEAANPGKIAIHPDLYNEAMTILNAACANPRFMRAFEASDKEVSFYGIHEATGLPIKARVDLIAKDFSFIGDLKSTSDIMRFEKQIFTLAYDVRLMHYVQTIKAVTGNLVPEIYFFPIESKGVFGSKTYRLSRGAVESALVQWETWMNEIAVCRQDNRWPGFSDEIVDVERPKYLDIETVSFEGVG